MKEYSITQAAELLEIKVHTIRYWEKHVPFLLSRRNPHGKRVYTNNELYVLYRINFLINRKHFTLKGAAESLEEEFSNKKGSQMRVSFLSLLDKLEHQKAMLQDARKVIEEIKRISHD